jgi:WD40 repeat protein
MTERRSTSYFKTRIISGEYRPRQFEYSLDGSSILFGTIDGKVCNTSSSFGNSAYNQINDFGLFSNNPGDSILGLCWFRKNNTKFISGSGEGIIKLGDINPTNNHIVKDYFKFDKLTSLHINSEDDYMLISGSTNNIRINDLETGAIVRQYDNIHDDCINLCRFSNNSPNLFATSSFDKSAKLWDMRIKNNVITIYLFVHFFK